ncbi:M14 family metallopeptidase [Sutcliffiella deserti]|uniref:M14 family metallopeptidase n=1 Tax=Sutcliffiella deserti TaxID=2875501 RepID=UPI001CBDAA6A|nr:M14 family zinc carboxypeptidase [Sutcliffiella deserti]
MKLRSLLITFLSAWMIVAYATQVQEAQAETVEETISTSISMVSMTEKREMEISFDFGEKVDLDELEWTFGDKRLEEWKMYNAKDKGYTGAQLITFSEAPSYVEGSTTVKATLEFDLLYGTNNLAPRSIRVLYPEFIGDYKLSVMNKNTGEVLSKQITYNVYDEYLTYDQLKPELDNITEEANALNDRFIEYKSLGQSYEGREIHFITLAKNQEAVDKYLNQTLPEALENPASLLKKIEDGTIGDYQVPIWFNNIHPDEVEGVDAQVELLRMLAEDDEITFNVVNEQGEEEEIILDVKEALDHAIFLFNFTNNPDGRVHNTRANSNGFDLNRDNAYQTQQETVVVTEEIAKWSPLSFLDLHGYVSDFLIEPCTPPHNPNFEFDLLIDNMLNQAHAMGQAGIANSDYDSYAIPYLDYENGWDDMTPAYTAIYSMLHGSLGHTIEVPGLNQQSLYAMVHAGLGAINFVLENKDELFTQQLELFKRGVEGEDNRAVDEHLVNQEGIAIGRDRGENANFFPDYYVLPMHDLQKNKWEAAEMVDYLLRNGVKVERTTSAVKVAGVTYPKGTYLVPMKQAKRGFANAVLYKGDDISDWNNMYDAIVVNFPDLRGFTVEEIRVPDAFAGVGTEVTEVTEVAYPQTEMPKNKGHYVIKNSNNEAVKAVNELLQAGKEVSVTTANGNGYNKGDYVVKRNDLLSIKDDYYLEVVELDNKSRVEKLKAAPKVAVVGSGVSLFVLKQLGFEITSVEEADIIVDDSGRFDKETILAGKSYIGIGGRALNSVQQANLLEGFSFARTNFYHEGLLKTSVNADSILTSGYSAEEKFYHTTGSWITGVPAGAEVLAQVVDTGDYFVAGWWPGKEQVQGQVTAFTTTIDEANITLFANDLVFRAHTEHSYRLLANAILLDEVQGKQKGKDKGKGKEKNGR